jgi:hypothetical protein
MSLLLFSLSSLIQPRNTNLANGRRLDGAGGLHGCSTRGCDGRLTGLLFKDLPEFEGFVCSGSGKHLAVGTKAAVQNARLVSWDLHVLHAGGVAPDAERVVRETASADDFFVVSAPSQASDLRVSGDVVDASSSGSVPEVDLTIVGSAASCEKV